MSSKGVPSLWTRTLPAEFIRLSVRAAATEANSDSFERPFVAECAVWELEAPHVLHPAQAPFGPTARTVKVTREA